VLAAGGVGGVSNAGTSTEGTMCDSVMGGPYWLMLCVMYAPEGVRRRMARVYGAT
jgi:hypothetical protein